MSRLLEEALDRLGVPIREEPLPEEARIAGGLCLINSRYAVFISPFASSAERVQVLAEALRHLDTESIWLPPAVRDLIGR